MGYEWAYIIGRLLVLAAAMGEMRGAEIDRGGVVCAFNLHFMKLITSPSLSLSRVQ